MIPELRTPEIQAFIEEHLYDDPAALMLKASKFPGLPMTAVVEQIQSKRKAKSKLPSWFATPGIVYPPKVSMEQCSSEATARYKAALVEGESMLDMTGGFGVDTWFLSGKFSKAAYVERAASLAEIAGNNFRALGAKNIEVRGGDGLETLEKDDSNYSLIYVDPARRGDHNQKVFRFVDCEPNLVVHMGLLKSRAETVMVKASPMLEIKQGIRDLDGVTSVHVVSVQNEVKELLFVIEAESASNPLIHCVDLKGSEHSTYSFDFELESETKPEYAQIGTYLYEPNAAIMKAGAFNAITVSYELSKLHLNTHLYTSDILIENFPGRTFRVLSKTSMNKKELRKLLPEGKANITVRNFPMTVAQIRKKTGLKEGGAAYLFGLTDVEGAKFLHCERMR